MLWNVSTEADLQQLLYIIQHSEQNTRTFTPQNHFTSKSTL